MIVWPTTQHRTESSAGETGALAHACPVPMPARVGATEAAVDAVRSLERRGRPGRRTAATAVLAVGASATGLAAIGVLAAAPAGAGLAICAVSDLASHRFSLRVLGVSAGLVALALATDATLGHSWDRLGLAAAGTAGVGVLLLALWLSTSSLALGDVLLVAFTVFVPLYLSIVAAALAVLIALVAAAGYVFTRAALLGPARSTTVPLGPALLVGWVCGVVIA